MIRGLSIVLGWLMLAASAVAQPFDDPRALLEAVYGQYLSGAQGGAIDNEALLSQQLRNYIEWDRDAGGGEIGRLDFDPFVNGQDYEIEGLEIGEPVYAGGKAVVRVTFENFGVPQDLGFLLGRNAEGGWQIEDLWNESPDFSYGLLDFLTAVEE